MLNLIDFLIETDSINDYLGYEPKCPNCGSKMIEIVYGMPSHDTVEDAKKGKVFLGGCMIEKKQPKYHCNKCRRSYYNNLKDYIKEEK